MPFALLGNSAVTSNSKDQPSRKAQFGPQRFRNEQTSVCGITGYDKQLDSGLSFLHQPSFLTRQRTHIGNMFTSVATWSNEGSTQVQSPVGPWSRTIVVASIMTLWVICLSFCAMSTDFAFNVEPPSLVPFEFCVYTSQMDFFASNRFPNTFKWRNYHIEVLFERRQLTHATAFGNMSTISSPILEYASISAGGRVIDTLTSATYFPSSLPNPFAIFSGDSEKSKHSPAVVLTDGMEPGECWALRGDFGQIAIQFTHAINLTSLVVGHAILPLKSMTSAPKELVLWGLKPAADDLCDTDTFGDKGIRTPDFGPGYCGIHLLSGIHNPLSVYQNFTISTHHNHYFDRVIVQVLANWGHETFTCMYRIQIYGNPQ